ncbi:MAG: hypothetical protein IT285_00580 [Bdellovibrionales bacterium]|nr:hypothetical protein [Bdellovibrionales bacterium]
MLAAVLLFLSLPAEALPLEQVFFHQGPASAESVAHWSSLPGQRSYVLDLGNPTSLDLRVLLGLAGLERAELESARYPGEDTEASWKLLASRGAGFVALNAGMPSADEIARLNGIAFPRISIVLQGFPGEDEAARLKDLRGNVSLTLVTAYYPRYDDRPAFDRLPATVPLLFVTDYWPWYAHMDVFNLIPQTIRLRVSNIFPDPASLDYLHHIRRLERVQVETSFDAPSADEWTKFRQKPVHWITREWVPSEAALDAFAAGGPSQLGLRRLTVDQDWDLMPEEIARLERQPLPVRWIRRAPLAPTLRRPVDRRPGFPSTAGEPLGRRTARWLFARD